MLRLKMRDSDELRKLIDSKTDVVDVIPTFIRLLAKLVNYPFFAKNSTH